MPPLPSSAESHISPQRQGLSAGVAAGGISRATAGASGERAPLRVHQDFAAADMVGDADDTVFLHPLDQARGVVVADAELALEVGGGGLLALRHGLDRLAVELRLGVVVAGRLALEEIAAVLRLFGHRLDIVRPALDRKSVV